MAAQLDPPTRNPKQLSRPHLHQRRMRKRQRQVLHVLHRLRLPAGRASCKNVTDQVVRMETMGAGAPDNKFADSVMAVRMKALSGQLEAQHKEQFKPMLDELRKKAEEQFTQLQKNRS